MIIDALTQLKLLYGDFKPYSILHGTKINVVLDEENSGMIRLIDNDTNKSILIQGDGKMYPSGEYVIYPSNLFRYWNYMYSFLFVDNMPHGCYLESGNYTYYVYPSFTKKCIRAIRSDGFVISDLLNDELNKSIREVNTTSYSDEITFKRNLFYNKLTFLLNYHLFTDGLKIKSLKLDLNKFTIKFNDSKYVLDLDTLI